MASGGYKKPTRPAPVSGPGKFAKRTDGGMSQPIRESAGGEYGEATAMRETQAAAPMNASGRTQTPEPMAPPTRMPTPFGAPTSRPGEPVTAGNPMGPGPGAPAMGAAYSASRLSEALRQIQSADVDGSLDSIILSLESNGL